MYTLIFSDTDQVETEDFEKFLKENPGRGSSVAEVKGYWRPLVVAYQESSVAHAHAEGSVAHAHAEGSVAHAHAEGSVARALVKGSVARALVKGSVAVHANGNWTGNVAHFEKAVKEVVRQYPAEAAALAAAIREGRIDGSTYEGECACLRGTIANARHCSFRDLRPDSNAPEERWFMAISEGMTPEKSKIAEITLRWVEEVIAEGGKP